MKMIYTLKQEEMITIQLTIPVKDLRDARRIRALLSFPSGKASWNKFKLFEDDGKPIIF